MFQKGVLTRRDVRSDTKDGDGWLLRRMQSFNSRIFSTGAAPLLGTLAHSSPWWLSKRHILCVQRTNVV